MFIHPKNTVIEIPLGSWDVRLAMLRPNGEFEFLNYSTQLYERILEKIRASKKSDSDSEKSWPVTQMMAIADWNGYSYTQLMNWKGKLRISN